ncbi:UNVERIFIED_CONTAM: hypothetical protein Slati_3506800 [Sesamum latifolium]|uniref:Secreted protein n=1 Tax=Sesamum latifolium TaxID=2727402 RepID=A0AAW2UIC3_9LAMI
MMRVSSVASTSSTSLMVSSYALLTSAFLAWWESPPTGPHAIIRITPLWGGSLESVLSPVPILGPPFGEASGDRFPKLSCILGDTHSG